MDYLRTLGSAAASSLLQKSGIAFPFILGEKVQDFDEKTIWTLYDATKRDDSSPVSVFFFDGSQSHNTKLLPIAKNALKKLKSIRHPDVLKFVDVFETESTVYIVTERVQPLSKAIQVHLSKSTSEKEDWLIWGLQRVSAALCFINESVASTHGNVRLESIFVASTGEWRLGGFEVLSDPKDDSSILYTLGGLLPDSNEISPPEVKKDGWGSVKQNNVAASDGYSLGILIHSIFNPTFPLPATLQPPHPPPPASARGAIPAMMFPSYKKLLHPSPRARMRPKEFLDLGMGNVAGDNAGFFANNRLFKICASLDSFPLANEHDKSLFLGDLKDSITSLPTSFASQRVVPSLVTALGYGGTSSSVILPLVLQLGALLPTSELNAVVIGPIVQLFSKPDRAIRMALLEGLPQFIDNIDTKLVTEKIWPHVQTGFSDTVPILREATVRAMVLIHTKLSDRILNNDLLRHLAKMQLDPEASIRTNTCILIGRIGPSLGYNTKRKVLVSAFARAMKDSFVHARVAGVMGFLANIDCFEPDEIATKVLPVIVTALIDKEKQVRDQALKATDSFVKRLEKHSSTMPETVLAEDAQHQATQNAPLQSTIVNSATGAAGALAGWAISSIGKRIASGDVQSSDIVSGSIENSTLTSSTKSGTSSATHTPVSRPPPSEPSGLKTLRLGTNENNQSGSLAWIDEEDPQAIGNEWNEENLIDINADDDDWGAFETANPSRAISLALPVERQATTQRNSHIPTPREPGVVISESSATSSSLPKGPSLPIPSRKDLSRSPSPISKRMSNLTTPTSTAQPQLSPPEEPPRPSNTVAFTKEEKAAEMARRKEERKQRIAMLKEHHKQIRS